MEMLSFPMLLESLFLLVSCFSQEPSEQPKKVEESLLVSTTATVEAIDYERRMVTVRGPMGDTWPLKAGDLVKNLDQIKVGDRIVADYYQSLAIEVVKVGTAKSEQETLVESAEPGEKPELTAKKRTLVATVEGIDYSTPSITLKEPNGYPMTVKVRHPERLKLVKVGDTLKITYQEALAIAIKSAPKESR
jgi:hypothetical protein